ncbi:hypothetical protein KI387_011407, partial [Taxus chinensis]
MDATSSVQYRIGTCFGYHKSRAHARGGKCQGSKNLVSREEEAHGKYPDPVHQKEVYQDTMDMIRSLQGEIQ